jgi:predicted methyltransferase
MAICDPDPEARAKIIRAALAPVADKLRQTGAVVSVVEMPGPITRTISMMVTTRGRYYEAVAAELEKFAARSGGTVYRANPAAIAAGDPDGECFATLSHTIARRRAA